MTVKTGRVAALQVTASPTATGVALQLKAVRTKLRDGRYTLRACTGARCVKAPLTVKRGKATLQRTTLRIAPGARLDVRVTGRGVTGAGRARFGT